MIPFRESSVRIVQLSDLHFGAKEQSTVWISLKEYIVKTLKPKLILVTGDIVETPKRCLYEEGKRELEELGIRYFVCAGNHDPLHIFPNNPCVLFFRRNRYVGNSNIHAQN